MFRLEAMNRNLVFMLPFMMCVALASCSSRNGDDSLPDGDNDAAATGSGITRDGDMRTVPEVIRIESLSCRIMGLGGRSVSLRGENLSAAHQLLRELLSEHSPSKSFRGIQTKYHLASYCAIAYYGESKPLPAVYLIKIFDHVELYHGDSGTAFSLDDRTKNKLFPFIIDGLSVKNPDVAEKIYNKWQWKATKE